MGKCIPSADAPACVVSETPIESTGDPIYVGVSACLLGAPVRFDGGHKRDRFIDGTLSRHFTLVPLCPEQAIGLGIPREPIRLLNQTGELRAVGVRTPSLDATDALRRYGRETGTGVATTFSGYILKSASPSCGMERVKVYSEHGAVPSRTGVGLYAQAIAEAQPLLPLEEEGRLGDPILRDNFIERVFVYFRWQRFLAENPTPARLIDFHTRHKLLVMAHTQTGYRRLGQLVAHCGQGNFQELLARYAGELMAALKRRATRRSHANVLFHLMGYLKASIDPDDKAELAELIERYRTEQVPLIVPLTLLNHHFRKHPNRYVASQYYLEPHPKELMLRNSV